MTWRVRVRPEVELDLLIAAGWYEAQRQGLGGEFIDELSEFVASLTDNALLYADRLGRSGRHLDTAYAQAAGKVSLRSG